MSQPSYLVSAMARHRLDEIYSYTRERWGEEQAQSYIRDLFGYFARIAAHTVVWRVVPIEFGVEGFYGRCGHHYVYWRKLSKDQVGIVTILHERMHQISRFQDDTEAW